MVFWKTRLKQSTSRKWKTMRVFGLNGVEVRLSWRVFPEDESGTSQAGNGLQEELETSKSQGDRKDRKRRKVVEGAQKEMSFLLWSTQVDTLLIWHQTPTTTSFWTWSTSVTLSPITGKLSEKGQTRGRWKKLHQQPQKKKGGRKRQCPALCEVCLRPRARPPPQRRAKAASSFSLQNEGRRPCWTSVYNFLGTK